MADDREVKETTLEGVVVEVRRSYHLVLDIDCDGETNPVELPVKPNNDVEVIPYQMALLGQQIVYTEKDTSYNVPLSCNGGGGPCTDRKRTLKILSGRLEGQTYQWELR